MFHLANSLISIYSGIFSNVEKVYYYENMTVDEKEDVHKNWLSYNDTFMIDVPPAFSDLRYYRASLGHKVTFIEPL